MGEGVHGTDERGGKEGKGQGERCGECVRWPRAKTLSLDGAFIHREEKEGELTPEEEARDSNPFTGPISPPVKKIGGGHQRKHPSHAFKEVAEELRTDEGKLEPNQRRTPQKPHRSQGGI